MLRITYHTDDGSGRSVLSQFDLLAKGILVGPEAALHGLVNNENGRRLDLILIAEDTASDQGDADGLEVIWHRRIEHHLGFLALLRRFAIGQNDRARAAVTAERQSPHQRHRSHSRHLLNSLDHLAMKIPLGGGLPIFVARQTVFQTEESFRFEADVYAQQFVEAAD